MPSGEGPRLVLLMRCSSLGLAPCAEKVQQKPADSVRALLQSGLQAGQESVRLGQLSLGLADEEVRVVALQVENLLGSGAGVATWRGLDGG
jgi:hypothetical protein